MVVTIIIKDDNGKQVKSTDFYAKPDENWEETSYKIGCKVARKTAKTALINGQNFLYSIILIRYFLCFRIVFIIVEMYNSC